MPLIEQAVMHHFEGNPGFDQCLVEAKRWIFDRADRIGSAVKRGGLLRIAHAYAGQGFFVSKIILVRVVPLVDFFYHWEPALVVRLGVEFCEGRTKILSHAICNPKADFVSGLDRILPAILVFQADAENTRNGLAAQGGAELLGAFAAFPWSYQTCSSLAIREQGRRKLSDGFHV